MEILSNLIKCLYGQLIMRAHLNRDIIFLGCMKDRGRVKLSAVEDGVEGNFKELRQHISCHCNTTSILNLACVSSRNNNVFTAAPSLHHLPPSAPPPSPSSCSIGIMPQLHFCVTQKIISSDVIAFEQTHWQVCW